jgi:CRISPR-associated protein (TIGR03984 family)
MITQLANAAGSVSGCVIDPLDRAACDAHLARILGEHGAAEPRHAAAFLWLLAHSDDGVTWGRWDQEAKTWFLGHESVPDVSPPIRSKTLQELRLFGETSEILIWRSEGGLRGRWLRETEPRADRCDESKPLRPSDECRILRGDHVVAAYERGFTRVRDRTGAEQVVPLRVNDTALQARQLRIRVRHYWEQDAGNGAVRIAATRLVSLGEEQADGT